MKRLNSALEVHHKQVVNKDYDAVLLLTGDEGKGKSHLALHILEWWYNQLYNEVKIEDVKHINLDMQQFAEDLKNLKRFEATVYDEAGDISNKRTMSKMNVLLSQAYQVIRGDNLLTILVLPSVFDLDGFFTKRRARGLIHVTKRGDMRYYSQRRLRKIVSLNQNRILKTLNVVAPTFVDTFPKYKGVLFDPYMDKKKEKMKTVRDKLYNDMKQDVNNPKAERDEVIYNIYDQRGLSETAKLVGLSTRQISRIVNKQKETDDIET